LVLLYILSSYQGTGTFYTYDCKELILKLSWISDGRRRVNVTVVSGQWGDCGDCGDCGDFDGKSYCEGPIELRISSSIELYKPKACLDTICNELYDA
jgi:hypothetical protein